MPEKETAAVIETHDLRKVFNDFWGRPRVAALNGLSMKVNPGEVFGLLGPNGSGKTTTIKILLGLLFPTSGSARVLGRSPRDVSAKANIGYLPEESYLYPYLDAEETLDFYGRLFHLDPQQRRERIASLLDLVGLNIEKRRPLREYSKGMARRIGIAQALINDPDLIILDEPTSGLDPIGNREVKDLVLRLKQRGKTILLCSHLLADVEDVCDRIAILYGGRIRREGTVAQLLTRRNVTQISAETLNDSTARKVIDLIRQEEGGKEASVQHPMTSLESFFLEVVEEAQDEEAETAGARMSRKKESFLTANTEAPSPSRNVLSQLVATGEQEPASETPDAQPAAPAVKADLLKDLSSSASAEDTGQEESGEVSAGQPEPDRELLQRLAEPGADGESEK